MFLTQLETSTLTNQNASTALLAHTFTNTTRERIVRVGVYLKDLAGNGDYSVYATKQLAGTGTAYPSVLTTQAVPSGVTAHWFTSEWLDVGATDVLKIYVVGLGGDTSAVDIITQVKEMFVSTDSSGRVDLVDAPNATAITAIQDALPTANENADALLDRAAGVETGLTPRQAWRLMAAVLAGKLTISGNTVTIRNAVADSKDRITATTDTDGQRTAVTTDLT